jgi:Na+/H+ antiporter NhaD/arsenite permease-like protein
VLVATAGTLWLGARWNGIERLATEEDRAESARLVQGFDERDGIESQGFLVFSAVMTLLFIVVIATTSVLPWVSDLGMGFVALAFAVVMLIRFKAEVDQFYDAVDWDLLGFFAGLFVVINVMEHAQVLALIGDGLEVVIGLGDVGGPAVLLLASAGFSSVTDNIPLAAMLARILGGLGTSAESPLWWSVVFGANLGGNITPIGSASTLVAVTIMHKHKLEMSFVGFVRRALPYAAVQLVAATIYVLAVLR